MFEIIFFYGQRRGQRRVAGGRNNKISPAGLGIAFNHQRNRTSFVRAKRVQVFAF